MLVNSSLTAGAGGRPVATVDDPLTMVRSKAQVDVAKINQSFQSSCTHLATYLERYQKNFRTVHCIWNEQSDDQRKHPSAEHKAYPFDGASDTKVPFIADLTNYWKKIFATSLRKMRIQAVPLTNSDEDVKKAADAGYLLKFLQNNIPNWYATMDFCACQAWDYTGVPIVKVEYAKEKRLVLRCYKLSQLAPELQQLLLDSANDDRLAQALEKVFPKMTVAQLKGCLAELRKEGETHVTEEVAVREGARVYPKSLAEDVILPTSTGDIQDSPYIHEVFTRTPEMLLAEAEEKGWDMDWAKRVVEGFIGVDSVQAFLSGQSVISPKSTRERRMDGLVQIMCSWEKRVDADGSIGIYTTVWHPGITDKAGKFELSDCDDGLYPFVAGKRENSSRRLYDTRALAEELEGLQFSYKECVDNASNRESISTFPPYELKITGDLDGNNDADIGPGTPYRTHGVGGFEWKAPPVGGESINVEVRKELRFIADQYVGRASVGVVPAEAAAKVQGEMGFMSDFVTDVMRMAYGKFRQFGSEEVVFKVTGSNRIVAWQNDPNDKFDFVITLDAESLDDTMKKIEAVGTLMKYDRSGKINNSRFIEKGMQRIDLILADDLVEDDQVAAERSLQEEREAINTLTSGQAVDIKDSEAFNPVKFQYLGQYIQSPAGQAQMKNPFVGPLLEKRVKQWMFKARQAQNAQIGRLGTAPGNAGEQ